MISPRQESIYTSMGLDDLIVLKQKHLLETINRSLEDNEKQFIIKKELIEKRVKDEHDKREIVEYYKLFKERRSVFLNQLHDEINVDILNLSKEQFASFIDVIDIDNITKRYQKLIENILIPNLPNLPKYLLYFGPDERHSLFVQETNGLLYSMLVFYGHNLGLDYRDDYNPDDLIDIHYAFTELKKFQSEAVKRWETSYQENMRRKLKILTIKLNIIMSCI